MVQWVWERAMEADCAERVVVATPDEAIAEVASAFGAEVAMTRLDHPSGTDRLAEVSRSVVADIYLNVQGDEPLVPVATIRALARAMGDGRTEMASVSCSCREDEIDNPAVVKVVTDLKDDALYFSRFAIPFARTEHSVLPKKHIGLYAYRREVLQSFASWVPTPLELSESLEQLRFLENGVSIRMVQGEASPVAVDTPEQAREAARLLAELLEMQA